MVALGNQLVPFGKQQPDRKKWHTQIHREPQYGLRATRVAVKGLRD